MKTLRATLFLPVLVSILSMAQGTIEMASRVDRSRITIGDLITYTVEITHSPDVQVRTPGMGANLGGFEIRDFKVYDPVKKGELRVSRTDYVISTFLTGEFQIPPLAIAYTVGTDTTMRILQTEPIGIVVESMKPSEDGDIRDIKAPLEMKRNWWLLIRWILLGLFLAGTAVFALAILRRKRAGMPIGRAKPKRPAHEIALEALEALRNSTMLADGNVKGYYTALSEILRSYLEGRYYVDALELTTSEVMEAVAGAEMESAVRDKLGEILETSDLVKFAKWVPDARIHTRLLDDAVDLINKTKIELAVAIEKPLEGEPEPQPAEPDVQTTNRDE